MMYMNVFDNLLDQAGVLFMKPTHRSLALLAFSVVMCGAAQAQDKAALTHEAVAAADQTAHITLETNSAPSLAWGSRTQVSGLFVDLIRPQQTWMMLKPSGAAHVLAGPIPRYLLPVTAPFSLNDNLAVHEPGFALFRFGF